MDIGKAMLVDAKNIDSNSFINHLPLIFLWMNTGCNARCGMCSIWNDSTATRLSVENIKKWLISNNQLNVNSVQLCGESTIHPELENICQSFEHTDIEIHLLTNGLRLNRVAEDIANSISTVTVSLDGPELIHNQVRGVKHAYRKLAEGIKILRKYVPDIQIEGRCVVHRLNYQALGATVDSAHELGLSNISFLGLDIDSDAFGREKVNDKKFKVNPNFMFSQDDLPLLEIALDCLASSYVEDFLSGYIVESRDVLQGVLVDYYRAMFGLGQYRPRVKKCNAPWVSAVVEPDSQLRPCFFLPAYGKLNEADSLNSLINSSKSCHFRDELATKGHPICSQCICPRHIDTGEETPSVKLF